MMTTTIEQLIGDLGLRDACVRDGELHHYDHGTGSWWRLSIPDAIAAWQEPEVQASIAADDGDAYSLWCAAGDAIPERPREGG